MLVVFCKQKTAYEMRISDWSSDVCSSDLRDVDRTAEAPDLEPRRILAGIDAAADDGAVDDQPEIGARPGDGADGDIAVGGADQNGRASCRERVCQYE